MDSVEEFRRKVDFSDDKCNALLQNFNNHTEPNGSKLQNCTLP
jgi:hypothetical protein